MPRSNPPGSSAAGHPPRAAAAAPNPPEALEVPSSSVAVTLGVSSAEQVVADPHNRDAVLRPRRDELPAAPKLCTAFILDVTRNEPEELSYSVLVRYSRFDRLRTELLCELPCLRDSLPDLPQKRGFDVQKLLGKPVPPSVIEDRTRQLDAWVRQILLMDGVMSSRALADLIFLGVGAEAAIREAKAAFDSAEKRQTSRLDMLTTELASTTAYAKACRERKDRADANSLRLATALEASAQLLARRRASASLASAWRDWSGMWRRASKARSAKEAAAAAAAIRGLRRRVETAEAEAAQSRAIAATTTLALAQADADVDELSTRCTHACDEHARATRLHAAESRQAAQAAE